MDATVKVQLDAQAIGMLLRALGLLAPSTVVAPLPAQLACVGVCPRCLGRGRVAAEPCTVCVGTGRSPELATAE